MNGNRADLHPREQPPADARVYSVSRLTRRLRELLEVEIGEVCVEGEISNARFPRSGHWYFTLKDDRAQLAVVLFRGAQRGAPKPRDGMQARVSGSISMYEPQGQVQLVARRLEEAGLGALHAAFEQLKARLHAEGLFDPARKRPLPLLPRRIGLVTSPTGAAVRDILHVLNRRFPNLHILLTPVRVQGAGAAEEIARAIDLQNEYGRAEVLIVGRGGGSIEDLWSFNEEVVARAMARSRIPVISAVGHEIDFTISDFTADLRAPTPSAAAELVVGRKEDFAQRLDVLRDRMRQALVRRRLEWRRRYERLAHHAVFREPGHRLRGWRERLTFHRGSLVRGTRVRLRTGQQRLDDMELRLRRASGVRLDSARRDLARLQAQLRTLDPAGVLQRGYSITLRSDGAVVRNAAELAPGDAVRTRLARGSFTANVKQVDPADG